MSLRYLSISQLSEVTGKDRRTVTKRLALVAPHTTEGRAILYDAAEAIETIFVSDSVEGMDKKLLKAELGLEIARQAKAEIEVGKLRGELIPIGEVVRCVEKEYSFVRAQIRSLPSKLAKPLSMIADPVEVHSRLLEAVNECLAELVADVLFETKYEKLNVELPDKAPEPEVDGAEPSEELP